MSKEKEKKVQVVLKYPHEIGGEVGSVSFHFGKRFTVELDGTKVQSKDDPNKKVDRKILVADFTLREYEIEGGSAGRVVTRKRYNALIKEDSFDVVIRPGQTEQDVVREKALNDFSDGLEIPKEVIQRYTQDELSDMKMAEIISYAHSQLDDSVMDEIKNFKKEDLINSILVEIEAKE